MLFVVRRSFDKPNVVKPPKYFDRNIYNMGLLVFAEVIIIKKKKNYRN